MPPNDCPIVNDWREMKSEFLRAVDEVKSTKAAVLETNGLVRTVSEKVAHLEKLDEIASVLGTLAGRLLWLVAGAIVLLGILLAVYVVRDSQTSLHATGPGGTSVHIGAPGAEKKTN